MNIVAMVDALTLALSHCELTATTQPETLARDLIMQLDLLGYQVVSTSEVGYRR